MREINRGIIRISRWAVLLLLAFTVGSSWALRVGKFSYKGAPENYNNGIINVNDTMVAMSDKIYVKNQLMGDSIPDTPSIFFVIDHSPSMSYQNTSPLPVNDQWGNRFRVTSALIDTLYAHYPSAEVGFAVFDGNLYLRPQDDTIFDTLKRNDPLLYTSSYTRSNGAYLPLLRLNRTYGNGLTGRDIIQYYLEVDTVPTPVNPAYQGVLQYTELKYNPRSRTSTNITIGFDAAKSAMELSNHQPASRYVIFLSDGLANAPSNTTIRDAYMNGTNVPTTFTIFFTPSTAVPANIQTMTNYIHNNGYSTNNTRTNAWPFFNSSFSSLMNFVMTNVYSAITTPRIARPGSIVIGADTARVWGADSSFTFNHIFPLIGLTTPFTYRITYQLINPAKDTTRIVNFNVRIVPGTIMDTSLFDLKYWNRDLSIRSNTATLATTANATVTPADETMDSLIVRLDWTAGTANYSYTNAKVTLFSVVAPRDSETYTLTAGAGFFSFKFKRAVSASPVRGNGILEHALQNDTILAVFRNSENPKLPLDTLRIKCPIRIGPGNILLTVSDDTIHAGDTANIRGVVRSPAGDVLAWLNPLIRWSQRPPVASGDVVIRIQGDSTRFTAKQAWNTNGTRRVDTIIAAIANPYRPTDTIKARALITIIPDDTLLRLYVERAEDTALSQSALTGSIAYFRTTRALSSIIMDSATTEQYAYAVVRDRFGNFVRLADAIPATAWTTLTPDSVTARAKDTNGVNGVGIIDRVFGAINGTGIVVVSETNLIPDTIPVILQTGKLIRLALFNLANQNQRVDTVRLTTDQNIGLILKGLWSTAKDTNDWTNVNGSWALNPNTIQFSIPVPATQTGTWFCDPITAGQARLILHAYNAFDTVPVIITEAPPSRLQLVLLTNPDSCYAGVPIKIAAYIGNTDGPVRGNYSGSSNYHDFLDNSLRSPNFPWIIVDTAGIAHDSLDKQVIERWVNGADTISLTLYYAPLDPDSLHQIQLTLNGILQASTIPFRLKPGPLDSIQIEDQPNHHWTDTIVASTSLSVALSVRGFDRYGNRIEPQSPGGNLLDSAIWSVDGTLPPLQMDSVTANIYYTTPPIDYDKSGNIWTRVVVGPGVTLRDFVPVKITAPDAQLVYAITQDMNGNGLIDQIIIQLNKNVVIDNSDMGRFSIQGNGVALAIDSITRQTDSVYTLHIRETRTYFGGTNNTVVIPQTAWTPFISVTGIEGVNDQPRGTFYALDGCPPVIWKVVKHISSTDHRTDTVRVYFSEKVTDIFGAPFSITNSPDMTFYAYTLDSAGNYMLDSSMFAGITYFTNRQQVDSILYFPMTNNRDLTDKNYLNIRTPNPTLRDNRVNYTGAHYGNYPDSMNQKVRVELDGNVVTINVNPNPSPSTYRHVTNGEIQLSNNSEAARWVRNEHAGVVITVSTVRFPPDGTTLNAYLKIYDVVGNVVNWQGPSNILENNSTTSGSAANIDIYWNGANKKGMLVAPGIYRVVVYLDYPANAVNLPDVRLVSKIGISR